MAMCTGEGSLEPLAQAEPVEQAMPAWSRATKRACRSRPMNATLDVVGRRSAFSPRISSWQSARFSDGLEFVAKGLQVGEPIATVLVPEFESDLHADGEWDGFGAGANAGLLDAAVKEWGELNIAAHKECADAERAAEFVGGDGHSGGAEVIEIQRELAGGLGGVGVERDVAVVADFGELGDGLEDAGFIVGEHGGDESGLRLQQGR